VIWMRAFGEEPAGGLALVGAVVGEDLGGGEREGEGGEGSDRS
jgi:hypothetical protein